MVLTYEQEREFENLKHMHRKEMAEVDHKNRMEELEKELEIAKANALRKD